MAKKHHDIKIKRKRSWDDKLLYASTDIILVLLLLIVGYPIIYVLSCSFSSGAAVSSGQVLLWPVDFSLQGYKVIFNYKSVWTGFGNTIFYTVFGTILNMVLSVLVAYPLSRPNYQGRKLVTGMFTFLMMFSAGLIPTYLLMSNLHLTNTRWALILIGGISTYNMIIIRTYFKNSIPGELIEAARIDGCSELRTLWSVVLPLSKSVLAVVTLYYAVGHWNSYFTAMVYLRKPELQPLQIVLRDILAASKIDYSEINDPELIAQMAGMADLIKYALIVVSSAPIIAAYPFVQKFFKSGVMIGSVKG
ncbi:MAG: carbohydrate ABC transporter permease [Ruminococcaceae bacterium]|nr:carbohydrate ABC transporter permease [Oscillospiraceae bacterium]